jgi:hypothetical protein
MTQVAGVLAVATVFIGLSGACPARGYGAGAPP